MNKENQHFDDNSLFQQNFGNDPFREEHLVFEAKDKREAFKLHIDSEEPDKKAEKNAYSIIKDAGRQIVASALILIFIFLLLNWSAYYQIGKNKFDELFGTKEQSPLVELVEEAVPTETAEDILLVTNTNEESSIQKIPEMDLEVTPLSNRLIIPRIDKNIPIIRVSSLNLINRDWGALEDEIQNALKSGVVHYPGTGVPGDGKNTVITGHSSYFPWDPGRFKDVFALLHDVVIGDKIVVYQDQEKYVYEITDIKIVLPDDTEVLSQDTDERLTLITCTPVGTNLKRLIVTAKPIADDNTTNVETKVISRN